MNFMNLTVFQFLVSGAPMFRSSRWDHLLFWKLFMDHVESPEVFPLSRSVLYILPASPTPEVLVAEGGGSYIYCRWSRARDQTPRLLSGNPMFPIVMLIVSGTTCFFYYFTSVGFFLEVNGVENQRSNRRRKIWSQKVLSNTLFRMTVVQRECFYLLMFRKS